MKKERAGSFLFGTLVAILIASFPTIAQAAPTEVVVPYGDEFYLNGQSYEFTGMNLRGICHYGKGDILPYTSSGHIDENLSGVAAMGGKVVRLFAPVKFASHQENVNRLKAVLDKMEPLGLKALISLTDLYNTGFNPQGDEAYYQAQPGGWTLLDDTWFAGGYQNNYLPYVRLAVTTLKDHNAIFAWELGNELTNIKNPGNIVGFANAVAAEIKSIDPWHMVGTGFISIDHTQIGEPAGVAFYSGANIDFISVHSYNGDDPWTNHAVHSRVAKPLVMGEFGWADGSGVDRPALTQTQMAKWFDQRACRGFLNWGYQAQSYDIGDGDNIHGIDRYAHSDFNALVSAYSNRASTLAARTHAMPSRLTPEGSDVAPSSTGWKADSSYDANNTGNKAFDGVIAAGSKWTSNGAAPPHWLALDLGRERQVTGFSIRLAGAAGERFDYGFKQFRLESGSSLDGPWTTEFDVDNSPQFSNVHRMYGTPQAMRFVRIYITDSGIDHYCRLPEFEVYETLSVRDGLWNLY